MAKILIVEDSPTTQAGFDEYITKPIDVRSFPEQVLVVLPARPT